MNPPARMSKLPFVAAWAVIVAAQVGALVSLWSTSSAAAVAVALGLQIVKVPLSARRIADTGRDPSQALLALMPFANLGLFMSRCMAATPSADVWERRSARWVAGRTAGVLIRDGLGRLPAVALGVLPLIALDVVVRAVVTWFAQDAAEALPTMDPEALSTWRQGAYAVTALLALYLMLNTLKRATASRASWLPTLMLPSAAMIAVALTVDLRLNAQLAALIPFAADMALVFTVDGLLIAGTVALAAQAGGHWPHADPPLKHLGSRVWEILAVRGGKAVAVTLGQQVVIPGIYYATRMALVLPVVVLEPARRPFERAAQLVQGVYGSVFGMLWLSTLVVVVGQFGAISAIVGVKPVLDQALLAGGPLDPTALAVGDLVAALLEVASAVVLVELFVERRRAVDASEQASG